MATYIIQRYCARNDTNGNPRRVIVVRDETGRIVATEDEGYIGRNQAGINVLTRLCGNRWFTQGTVIDIGDVDVRPGIVARLVKWQEGDGQ